MNKNKKENDLEYAKTLLKLSGDSSNYKTTKSTLGELLSTPMKRAPFIRPYDRIKASDTLLNLSNKKMLFIFIITAIVIFYIFGYFIFQ